MADENKQRPEHFLASRVYGALLEISMLRDVVRSFGDDVARNEVASLMSHLHLLEGVALQLSDHVGVEDGAGAH
jgi:hypothetical protein